MRPRTWLIRTIAGKELREALRDRRTLFMMVIVPMLLYPALLLVVTQVTAMQQEELSSETSRVGVAESASDDPLLAEVVSHLEAAEELELEWLPVTEFDAPEVRLASGEDDDADALSAIVDLTVDRSDPEAPIVVSEIHFRSIVDRSRLARERVQGRLSAWAKAEVDRRLDTRALPPALASPTEVASVDHADRAQRGGFILGAVVPLLVVVTVLLGAFYPAIDLTAGEKERGTIQTLFTAPVTVFEVVAGKYLAVVGIALVSGLANLLSMGLMFGVLGESMFAGADIAIDISPAAVLVLALTIVMIAVFFSAVVLAVAVLARDFKDAQNLMTPVFLVALLPGMIAQLPGFELTPQLAMVPGVNVILLMKQALVHGPDPQSLFLVGASTLATTLVALVIAARLFAQETVLVGERGRFDLLARPSEIRPRARPSVSEGLAWVGVMFILLFYAGSWLQSQHALGGLAATLWLVLALPTIGVARYLKLDWRETFAVRTPRPRFLLAAVLLGVSAWVGVGELTRLLEVVLPIPPELVEAMEGVFAAPDTVLGWVGLLLVAAVSPAICEELVFRGFLFSALRDRVSTLTLLVVTAGLFGAFHLSIYRLFPTFTLGLVMGLLVWRSRSIVTSMVFHGSNNGMAIGVSALLAADGIERPPVWLLGVAIAGTVAGLWLLRGPSDDASASRVAET